MSAMTVRQRTELDAAIERATEAGLEVVAHGYRKSNPNIKIYCVPSQSEANRWHVVSLYGSHLVCDCKSRVICAHRAAVHMELVVEAAKQAMHAAEIERAFESDVQATCAEMEPPTRSATSAERVDARLARIEADRAALNRSPKPRDDQRVFSLYK
jgi:hypothetical protein